MTGAGVLAAAAISDDEFLRAHLPDLEPVADRFACVGHRGIVLGPVSYAIGSGRAALGDRDGAVLATRSALAMSEQMGAKLWIPRARGLLNRLE